MNIDENDLNNFKLRYVTLRLKKSEIRQTYYFFADLNADTYVDLSCNEGEPEWIDYDKIFDRNMPHTAEFVLRHYLKTGINNSCVYGGIATKDDVIFTKLEEF